MKTLKTILAILMVGRVAFAAHTTMDIFVTNYGLNNVPPASSYASGQCLVTAEGSAGTIGNMSVGIQGLAVGAQVGTFTQFTPTVTDGWTYNTAICGDPNVQIVSVTMGVDANGAPAVFVGITYNPQACTQDYTVTAVNPSSLHSQRPTVTFSDGTVDGPYNNIDPSGTFTDTIQAGCGLTWSVTWTGSLTYTELTNGVQLPDDSSGEPPMTNAPPDTTTQTPTAPPDDNSNIVWQPSGTSPATTQNIQDLGNGLNNTLWTANQQNQLDSSAIVQAVNSAKAQAHTDAGTLKGAIDTEREQNHSDLSTIAQLIQNVTNGMAAGQALTNYALNSTLVGLVDSVNTNASALYSLLSTNLAPMGGLGGALTNAAGAVNGLASAISNMTDITNLDIASESTLEGGTNLLFQINSNLTALGTNHFGLTNYAQETTLEGMSNLLAGIATNGAGGSWTNGLTLDQLTNEVSAYQEQLSNSQADALAQMSVLTNQAGQMGMASVASAVQGGLPGSVEYDSPAGLSPQVITLASGVSFSLGSNMPSYGPLRQVLAWATIVGLFLWNWRTTYSKIRDVFTANQARTAGTEFLGSNVNLSSAMLMAVAIFAAATAIPTFAVALLTNEVSLFVSVGNPLSLFGGFGWGYSFLDQYIPLATVISAVTTRVVFNVVIDSIAAVVMGIKLFLVGL